MVRKLLKHEMIYYFRTLMPFELILLGIACIMRVIQLFESPDNRVYSIFFGTSVFAFVMAIIVAFVLLFIVGIVRFYRNLFTNEGYLMFTLPVTATEHLWAKLLTALLFNIITVVVVVVSILIATAGEFTVELFKAIGYLWNDVAAEIGTGNLVFFVIEIVCMSIVSIASGYMIYYTCIAIGQLARKNRVLAAVGVYFAYYIIVQIIGSVFSAVMSITLSTDQTLIYAIEESFSNMTADQALMLIHGIITVILALSVLVLAVFFFITRHIMSEKLNLE